ncbi:MAG TPA: hypothetical protein PLW44_10760 [Chitinophagales bacterium]|nr:hypothetical protein [Chitinophagales bacterium]
MPQDYTRIKAFYRMLMPEPPDASWAELEKMFEWRTLRKGDFILRAGETSGYVTFINEGIGRLYYTVEGKEIVSGFFS